MARREITIPINKSSNDSKRIYTDGGGSYYPPYLSDILYMSNGKRYSYPQTDYVNNIGLSWDMTLIPINKKIISTEIFLYSKSTYISAFIYKKAEFNEGNDLPRVNPSDGSITGVFSSGWNNLLLLGDIGNSIIIENTNSQWEKDGIGIDYNEFHSSRNSVYKPYVIVAYDDIPPDPPSSLYPDNTLVNTRDIIRFSWLHNSQEFLQQKSFILQYSTNGGSSWVTVNQTTPNQYYDMTASTLPTSGTVIWKVMTMDSNDVISGYTTSSFTLGVVPQKAPIPVAPISQFMDQTKPIKFEWIFIGGSSGETQSKYDLQHSIDGGTNWTTVTNLNGNKYYELASNTLASGNITWRVRTYNNWNEVSPYSENRSFTVIGSPAIPQIVSVTNSAKPTISWTSSGQHLYELQILKENIVILDTGSITSVGDRSFKLEDYLKDGDYIARLRILNEYNLYSPLSEKSFVISTVKPSKPIMEIYNSEYSITIKTSNTSLKSYVYRDNELICEVIKNSFTDYTGENKKEYQYFIRTIDVNDNFNDSDIKLARCKFNDNTIALLDNPEEFIRLSYGLGSIPKKSYSFSVIGNLVYFDGRKNPVAEFSEFEDESKTLGFFVKEHDEVDALKELISKRQLLIYRDSNGKNIVGTVLSIQSDNDILGYNIGVTITRCRI